MRIGIIVWSATGHSLSVAERLAASLADKGHSASIERIAIDANPLQRPAEFALTRTPPVSGYDALVLASPVEAFSLSPVMERYLAAVGSLSGKRAFCLVTQYFPKPWMGGNRAVRQMKNLVEAAGGIPAGTAVINWSSRNKENQILSACQAVTKLDA